MSTKLQSFGDFLALFPEKPRKKAGAGFLVICPAHNDHNPSLWITPAKNLDFIADIKCQAGCPNEEVLSAIHLTRADVRQNGHGHKDTNSKKPEIEATYKYTDANGKPFEVIRTNPKGFFQRQPDGKGGYINNLDGIIPTLYHLAEIKTAISNGDTIWVTEGEKDVDNLWNIGLVATCNPMGALKWREAYTDSLADAKLVIILPDNDLLTSEKTDAVGLEHAHNIAVSLASRCIRVKLFKPFADAKDVSDWLALGHTLDELEATADATADFTPGPETVVLRCMSDIKQVKVEWFWYPYIPKGKIILLEGDPGEGKSWISLALATSNSLGKGLPNFTDDFTPGTTLVLSAEDGLADTIKPRLTNLGANNSKIFAIDGLFTLDIDGCLLLESYIKKLQPNFVIIDPLVAYISGNVDINKANMVRQIMAHLARLADMYSIAILAVRHLTKGGSTKDIYRGLGSIDFTASARSVLLAGSDPESGKKGLVHVKSNLAQKGVSIGYELKNDTFFWTGTSDLTSKQIFSSDSSKGALDDAIAFLTEQLSGGKVGQKEIQENATAQGISFGTLYRAKGKLNVVSKQVGETGKKGAGKWFWKFPEKEGVND